MATTMNNSEIDASQCLSVHGYRNKAGRALWACVFLLLFRPTPTILRGWRRFLLRLFGAKIGRGANVYSSCRIWAPWNLEMGEYSCLSHYVDCYCVAPVRIGDHATVSQYSYLCAATHDESDPRMSLIAKPIVIGEQAWICADVYIAPGVTVGAGTVVGARSSVFKDLPDWKICVGTPARPLRDRILKSSDGMAPVERLLQ